MRSASIIGRCALVAGIALALSGCQVTGPTCGAGLVAVFDLTVVHATGVEPSVQYCALGRCSPRPHAGPIPRVQRDPADDHAATVTHVGRGAWRIEPRSTGTTPATAEIRLYRDGELIATRVVHLRWTPQDPCAASNPPNPHPTIRS